MLASLVYGVTVVCENSKGIKMQKILGMVLATILVAVPVWADFGDSVAGFEKRSGLTDVYVNGDTGKVYLVLDAPNARGVAGRYVHAAYLTAGLGSNPVGLDRSVPGGSNIIAFHKMGGKIAAMIENTRYRATARGAEANAVATSFAQSIIWTTDIIAEDAETGRLLIDLTDFLTSDPVGVNVAATLKRRGQGSFKLNKAKSFIKADAVFAFPTNLEFDAYVTFDSAAPGGEVQATTPVPGSVTLIAHNSFLKMPDDGYKPRRSDPRAATISVDYVDMSAPLAGNTVVSLARRFRLEKDADGRVSNPIIFYIDHAAPEPIRGALLDGARWWADAFDKAGYKGGYRAEILPEDVHPLDARYNVVNWVHRATRGWSYGAAIHDPRTGEALRGVVLLGSLRVRQDIKIFEALGGAAKTGTGDADDPVQIALQRIRQLSAHEIGHALGFAHNMAASSYGRESVMDYPAPDVKLTADGVVDFSNAYGVGMGAWDDWTVNFLYGDYDGDERQAQEGLLADAYARGLRFVSDADSRPGHSGNIHGSLWDNGTNAVDTLVDVMKLRRHAIANFGDTALRRGESALALQTKFVPLYLYHRYQLQAAAKYIGGYAYEYRAKGDGRALPVPAPLEAQMRAADVLLATLSPKALEIPTDVQAALMPVTLDYADPQFAREVFDMQARPTFDRLGAASVAADLTLRALLHPARLARVHDQGLQAGGCGSLVIAL